MLGRPSHLKGRTIGKSKKVEQLYQVSLSTPCLDDHHITKEELEMAGEFVKKAAL